MTTTAENMVAQARRWLGRKESNGSHREIVDIYNAHKPLARSYKVKYTDSWCATFVSTCAITLGATDIIPTECSCEKMIELCKKKGIWHEDESIIPQVGDVCFYDWGDSGNGDNKGWSDHVGIVENVGASTFTVIEGNYSKAVKRRVMKMNGKHLRGFARPKYETMKPSSTKMEEIVKQVQRIIGATPDGVFGKKSEATWGSRVIKEGSKGDLVRLVQKALICCGYSVGKCGADGVCGKDTAAAIKRFQQDNGLVADVKCGRNTVAKLFM